MNDVPCVACAKCALLESHSCVRGATWSAALSLAQGLTLRCATQQLSLCRVSRRMYRIAIHGPSCWASMWIFVDVCVKREIKPNHVVSNHM